MACRHEHADQQQEIDALLALRPGELERLLDEAVAPFFDRTLDQRFDAVNTMPEGAYEWFKSLPAYMTAVEAIGPQHRAALEAAEALTEAIDHHVTEVRKAAREVDDVPPVDPIDIKPEITTEPPEPLFHSLDDSIIATRKLIARRDGSEGGAMMAVPMMEKTVYEFVLTQAVTNQSVRKTRPTDCVPSGVQPSHKSWSPVRNAKCCFQGPS